MTTKTFAFDLGNRFIKAYDGIVKPWALASVHTDILSGNVPPIDTSSVNIRYHTGKPALMGKHWVVGVSARDARKYTNTVSLSNKTEVALKLLLAMIRPTGYTKEVVIDPLYMSVPNPAQDSLTLNDAIVGTHQYTCSGASITAHINRVIPVAEGLGGYHYALRQGVIQTGGVNGVLDLGGGTAIASLYSANGQEILEARAVFRKGGSYSLAADLAGHPELSAAARGAPQIDMILDAIAAGTYQYGTTGYSFRPLFDQYREVWWSNLIDETIARWDTWFDRIEKIVLIGGAAPLARGVVDNPQNSWLVICPDTQYANVLGLIGVESKAMSLRSA